MDQKTVAKLREWMRKYGHAGTFLVGSYLMLHSFRSQRRALIFCAVVLTGLYASLLWLPPRQTNRTIHRQALPVLMPTTVVPMPAIELDAMLLDAVLHKDLPRVRAALTAKADVDATDAQGYTALMLAVEGNQDKIVRLLLEHNADVDVPIRNANDDTPLSLAVGHKNAPIVRLLLDHMPSGPDPGGGRIAPDLLVKASADGANEIIRLLCAHGTDIEDYDAESTPLEEAAANHHPDTMALLLALGVHIDAKSRCMDATVLGDVAAEGDLSMVEWLVARGADVNSPGRYESILQTAVDHPAIVRFLLRHGAKVNVSGKGDFTPLLAAAYRGNAESVQILMAYGADGNHISEKDGTALTIAAAAGHADVVKALLRWGVDVNLRAVDSYGYEVFATALQAAKENHHPEIVRLLKKAGARD